MRTATDYTQHVDLLHLQSTWRKNNGSVWTRKLQRKQLAPSKKETALGKEISNGRGHHKPEET